MVKILNIKAREIFDSRGNPTVECEMLVEGSENGFFCYLSIRCLNWSARSFRT